MVEKNLIWKNIQELMKKEKCEGKRPGRERARAKGPNNNDNNNNNNNNNNEYLEELRGLSNTFDTHSKIGTRRAKNIILLELKSIPTHSNSPFQKKL